LAAVRIITWNPGWVAFRQIMFSKCELLNDVQIQVDSGFEAE
jgi:hypothetical protein